MYNRLLLLPPVAGGPGERIRLREEGRKSRTIACNDNDPSSKTTGSDEYALPCAVGSETIFDYGRFRCEGMAGSLRGALEQFKVICTMFLLLLVQRFVRDLEGGRVERSTEQDAAGWPPMVCQRVALDQMVACSRISNPPKGGERVADVERTLGVVDRESVIIFHHPDRHESRRLSTDIQLDSNSIDGD